jgi:hypothetical protein
VPELGAEDIEPPFSPEIWKPPTLVRPDKA